eukprot:TRINITY_DN123909_c0_g1_i1.p1 TRINITY_DN123909_c0_g1~~TRINITY_DN123909_c0_g1_i1.p1  ORF type:complete len:597 (+),score=186.98 TRINITY_DN123909_c0_g1_i1:59-1792(+)
MAAFLSASAQPAVSSTVQVLHQTHGDSFDARLPALVAPVSAGIWPSSLQGSTVTSAAAFVATAAATGVAVASAVRSRKRAAARRSETVARRVIMMKNPPTAAQTLPDNVKAGPYAKEAEEALAATVECIHVSTICQMLMEELKDAEAVGLFGPQLEKRFVRRNEDGEDVLILGACVMTSILKRLMEKFPDDVVLVDADYDVFDEAFTKEVAMVMSDFKVAPDCTTEDVLKWAAHAKSYDKAYPDSAAPPKRYWVLQPMDNAPEMRSSRPFCYTLTLMVDEKPVVAFMGAPNSPFDHHSRTRAHPEGLPVYFAVEGCGTFIQLVMLAKSAEGYYSGRYFMKGKPLPLCVHDKISRGTDNLFSALGTEQLTISQASRLREDIFIDAERVANLLGSKYPKFEMINSCLKYAWLAGGKADICWYFPDGLYDQSKDERLANHAAGYLLVKEAGADIADLEGEPLKWIGKVMSDNRGIIAVDSKKAALQGVLGAIKDATSTSVENYEVRKQKRKEVSKMLANMFAKMGELAETDEEKEGAAKVMEKGLKMLADEAQMNDAAQRSLNRAKPILGDGPIGDGPVD